MKYGIVINTFYRKDGKTKEYITATLNSINSQTYKDYTVFLIGDKYEKESEFHEISSIIPRDKIVAINLPYAKERDKYINDIQKLHHTGGANARNIGIEIALLSGISYVLNLDHDDLWEPDHLENINRVVQAYPEAVFICTKATHIGDEVLPKINSHESIIEFYPVPCGIINSSTCINFSNIPFRYVDTYETLNRAEPSDAYLWVTLNSYMKQNGLKGYAYNKISCHHSKQGEAHGKTI